MNSIAHLKPSRGKYAAVNIDQWTPIGRPKPRTIAWQAVLLAFGMGGFVALILLPALLMRWPT